METSQNKTAAKGLHATAPPRGATVRSVIAKVRCALLSVPTTAGAALGWCHDVLRHAPAPLLVGIVAFAVYCYKPLIQSCNDNAPLRFGAVLLARSGSLNFSELNATPTNLYSFRKMPDGTITSHTPIGTAVLAAPVFFAARLLKFEFVPENIVALDSLAATLMTAAAAGMMTFLTRRHGRRTSIFLGFAMAFATASWSTASRCLWAHTGAQFALMAGLCLLDSGVKHPWRTMAGVLALVVTLWCRPFFAPACALILLYQFRHNWRFGLQLAVVAAVGIAVWMGYNSLRTGNVLGTYVYLAVSDLLGKLGPLSFYRAFVGSTFSPNRGMFVFSPLLLLGVLAIPGLLRHWRGAPHHALFALISVVAIAERAMTPGWHGGFCYGSRYMLDVSPFLLLAMAPLAGRMLTGAYWKRSVIWGLFLLSTFIQFLGVAREYTTWNTAKNMIFQYGAWDWRQSQILHCLTYGKSTAGPFEEASAYDLPGDGVIVFRDNEHNPYIRYGFANLQPWGLWAEPPRAGIAVNIPVKIPIRMQVKLGTRAFPFDPTHVDILWNGVKVKRLTILVNDFAPTDSPWFNIPDQIVKLGINEIELRVSRDYYGLGASTEPIGAAVDQITILPR